MRMKDHEWIINTWLVHICMCTSMSSWVWACGGISILPIKLSICAGRSFKTTYPKCCPVQNTIPKLNPNCKRLQEAKHIGTYQCRSTPKHGRLHDGYVKIGFILANDQHSSLHRKICHPQYSKFILATATDQTWTRIYPYCPKKDVMGYPLVICYPDIENGP